ncbi:MAG: copper-binding protein [Betaproteobacteria bacterium]|nr:copper-binding protein [Betaproteobacteria bacterium]
MKSITVAALTGFALAFSAPGLAADDHAGHGAMHAASPASTAMADGLIKAVNKAAGKVTISHGPLTNLGMGAMTMEFRVKNAAWLEQIKAGDKIRFVADDVNGVFTVVQFEKAK